MKTTSVFSSAPDSLRWAHKPADRVVQTDEQGQIAAPGRILDVGGHAFLGLVGNFQGRVHGVVSEIEEPRLVLVAFHEADGLIGEDVGCEAIDFCQLPAAVNQILRHGGRELRLGVFAQGVIVGADEEAEEIVEAARLRMMVLAEAEMPFADQAGGISGRTQQIGQGTLARAAGRAWLRGRRAG